MHGPAGAYTGFPELMERRELEFLAWIVLMNMLRIETQEREAKHCQLPLDENVPQGGWT